MSDGIGGAVVMEVVKMTTKEQAAIIEAISAALRAELAPVLARLDRVLARCGKVAPR